tara:strand:- start:3594 stop:3857 length:264 start_codon:yes stop_codon:yes gene_type:complete
MEHRTLNNWYLDTPHEMSYLSDEEYYVIRGDTQSAAGGCSVNVMTCGIKNSETPLNTLEKGVILEFKNFTYTLGERYTNTEEGISYE